MSSEVILGGIIALIIAVIGFWYGLKRGIKDTKESKFLKFSKIDKILLIISAIVFLLLIIFIF